MGTGTLTNIDSVSRIDNQSMSLCWLLTEGRRNCLPLKKVTQRRLYIYYNDYAGKREGELTKKQDTFMYPAFNLSDIYYLRIILFKIFHKLDQCFYIFQSLSIVCRNPDASYRAMPFQTYHASRFCFGNKFLIQIFVW